MDISNQIQIIYIPWWIRVIVLIVIASSAFVCGFLFYRALVDGNKPDWIEAGAYILGVLFPILIIVIVIAGASFGEKSVIKRTEQILTKTLPYHLQFIPEEQTSMHDFRNRTSSSVTPVENLAKVELHHTKGRCYADYHVSFSERSNNISLRLRVELNVKRVNVNLIFLCDDLTNIIEDSGSHCTPTNFLQDCFKHALNAADMHVSSSNNATAEASEMIAYTYNNQLLSRNFKGQKALALVATSKLASDTLWNPSEKVFFAQDLVFMLRAFVQEKPNLFLAKERANA